MASVEWVEAATKDLEKLDKKVAKRVLTKITWLSTNFEQVVPEPLSGDLKGAYKLRVGDFRVVYGREGEKIAILAVGHRKMCTGRGKWPAAWLHAWPVAGSTR